MFDFSKVLLVLQICVSLALGFWAGLVAYERPGTAAVFLAAAWMVWPSKRL